MLPCLTTTEVSNLWWEVQWPGWALSVKNHFCFCFDSAGSGSPSPEIRTSLGNVGRYIQVHPRKRFFTKLHASKQTHDPHEWSGHLQGYGSTAIISDFFLCVSPGYLVFRSLLHCRSISSICSSLGAQPTLKEKLSANQWSNSCCSLLTAATYWSQQHAVSWSTGTLHVEKRLRFS